jgi:hypothetical protein
MLSDDELVAEAEAGAEIELSFVDVLDVFVIYFNMAGMQRGAI